VPVLEPNAEWLAMILDTMDEGIHVVDKSGVTIVYNAAAGKMDGVNPKDVIGKHVLSVFPSLHQETSTLLKVLKTGRAITNAPQTYTNFLGTQVHTVNTTLPIRSGKHIVGALEIAKDLTQVKHLSDQVLALQARVVGSGRKASKSADGKMLSGATYTFEDILTIHPPLADLKRKAARAARTNSPILVFGETGTGKELLVQAIHNASPRSERPFLALNCAAIPASLQEGILFGTVRGSFTGADDRPGLFELADGGTLFLDEIQSMPPDLQAKLLRVLQEGEFIRVGDTKVRHTDIRIVAAMNASPERAVESGALRRDIYYRLNVVRFDLPPLASRREDIDLLTETFLDKWNTQYASNVQYVSASVRQTFQTYPWPGNVRELANAVESAVNLTEGDAIEADDLPILLREWARREREGLTGVAQHPLASGRFAENPAYRADILASAQKSAGEASTSHSDPARADQLYGAWADALVTEGMNEFWANLEETPRVPSSDAPDYTHLTASFERMILRRVLQISGGNVRQAAARLGLPRQTLQYRLKQMDVRME